MTNPQLISYAAYPLRSRARQECLFTPLLFNIILEVLPRTVSQEKERKDIWIENKEVSPLAGTTEAHAPQEKPLQWEACALQLESSLHLPQLEKSPHSNEYPAQPKII